VTAGNLSASWQPTGKNHGVPTVIGMLCRISDRTPLGWQGAEVLARALARRAGVKPALRGTPGQVRESQWEEDLRRGRECLREAGERIGQTLAGGGYPVLCAPDCSVGIATLPALARERPDAWVLWIDAHGDYNSPDTTLSGFLGGMTLAGACGVWDTGMGVGPDPSRVILCGSRSLDPDERHLLAASQVQRSSPSEVKAMTTGKAIYVHLDLDVLDPSVLPGEAFPASGGLAEELLHQLLADVAAQAELVGCEITDFTAPELAGRMAETVAPLVPHP
jgi:arginase